MRTIGENMLIIFGTAAFGLFVFRGAIRLMDEIFGASLRYHNKQAARLGVTLYKGRQF